MESRTHRCAVFSVNPYWNSERMENAINMFLEDPHDKIEHIAFYSDKCVLIVSRINRLEHPFR